MGRRGMKTDFDNFNRVKEVEKKKYVAPEMHDKLPQDKWHNND